MQTIEIEKIVGLLTKTGEMNGFILARCACSYPCVIAPQDWGRLYGCSSCHEAEKARMDEAQKVADKIARADAKEKALAEQNREFWQLPHLEELNPRQRRLFKSLIDQPSFSLSTIAAMTKSTPKDAWEKLLLPLISANCLIELVGYLGQSRAYSDKPYELSASNASNYRVRGIAVKQMRTLEAEALAEARSRTEPETPTVYASADVLGDEIRDFITNRCITGEDLSESEVMLRVTFVAYAEGRKQEPLSVDEYYTTLDRLGYSRQSGKVLGLRLMKTKEIQVQASAK